MPYFYFHVWRGGQLAPDEVGLSLPTLDAAKRRAESMVSAFIGHRTPIHLLLEALAKLGRREPIRVRPQHAMCRS